MCNIRERVDKFIVESTGNASQVWQRLHMDFGEAMDGKMWLIIVDAVLKWPEVSFMRTTTVEKTIDIFSKHGLPEQVVVDSGLPFIAKEFKEWDKCVCGTMEIAGEVVGSNTYRVHHGIGSRWTHADQLEKRVSFWEEENPQKVGSQRSARKSNKKNTRKKDELERSRQYSGGRAANEDNGENEGVSRHEEGASEEAGRVSGVVDKIIPSRVSSGAAYPTVVPVEAGLEDGCDEAPLSRYESSPSSETRPGGCRRDVRWQRSDKKSGLASKHMKMPNPAARVWRNKEL
ncbi:hypothetical protein COOONC_06112 [Cooperia oncophora]